MAPGKPIFSIPLTILLADANRSYREITRKMLKFYDASFIVDGCASIADCLKRAKSQKYDLILAEEKLEDGDNFDLLEALKQANLDTPVLMLLQEGHEQEALAAIDAGAIDYITKARGYLTALPFTVKKILEKERIQEEQKRKKEVGPPEKPFSKKGYFILNHQGKFMSVNPGMESLIGYAEDELIELTLLDLLPRGKEWHFFEWLQEIESKNLKTPFETDLVGKYGVQIPVSIRLRVIRDAENHIKSYRGEVAELPKKEHSKPAETKKLDYGQLIDRLWELTEFQNDEPMPKLLGRLAKVSCQIFKFKRATVALLDRSKKVYIKVAMVGYALPAESEKRRLEVPKDVIDRIFANRYRIKVLYYNQDKREDPQSIASLLPERRSQKRRPPNQWHPRDVVVMNLANRQLHSFGYISLDDPLEIFAPSRNFFTSLELFSRLASMMIENHSYLLEQAQRTRRLTQVLVTSNIFKLYFRMDELLKEVVWSVKFSLGFNLVLLGLISQKTQRLEIRSVACDDKIKAQQLMEVEFDLAEFLSLLRPEYKAGKSYLIKEKVLNLQTLKEIYYNGTKMPRLEDEWPYEAMIIIPLKSRYGKIMGAILVDDPADLAIPNEKQRKTLEILANQISVAIENRILYVEAKRQTNESSVASSSMKPNSPRQENLYRSASTETLRPFWHKFFRGA